MGIETSAQCPVCGYYCLGNGGEGCIDKPSMLAKLQEQLDLNTPRAALVELQRQVANLTEQRDIAADVLRALVDIKYIRKVTVGELQDCVVKADKALAAIQSSKEDS